MSTRKQIRVHGFVRDDDGGSPSALVLYEDGTETTVTVGANDILYIDSYNVGATTGITTLFFSDDGVNNQNAAIIAQFALWGALALPHPIPGRPGDKIYLGSTGVNRVEGTITGYLYQA